MFAYVIRTSIPIPYVLLFRAKNHGAHPKRNETNYVPYLVGSFAAVSQIVDRARRADRCNLTSEPNKLSDLIFFFFFFELLFFFEPKLSDLSKIEKGAAAATTMSS